MSEAHTTSLVSTVDLWICIALLLSCVVLSLRHSLQVPTSALLLLAGFSLRIVGQYVDQLDIAVSVTDNIEEETILLLFLPALIFECAYTTEWYTFKRELWQIILLATSVVITSSLLTAVVIRYVLGFDTELDWHTAIMLGAILSATDHVAVVSQLKEVQADYRLETLIQGETLVNEGTIIVLFTVMMKGATTTTVTTEDTASLFFRLSLGGIAMGLGFAIALTLWLKRIVNQAVLETLLTLITTYLLFYTAELPSVHVSGAFAVVTLGLYMSAYGKTFISPLIEKNLHEFWSFIGTVTECLILILGGMLLGHFLIDFESLHSEDIGYLFALFALLHVVRAVIIVLHWPLLRLFGYGCSTKDLIVLIVGALKGTFSTALSLLVYHNTNFTERIRDLVLFWGVGVSALSIVFDAMILHIVVRVLGLESLTPVQESMLISVTASILQATNLKMANMKDKPGYLMVNWDHVVRSSGPEKIFYDMMKTTRSGRKVLGDVVEIASTEEVLRLFQSAVKLTEDEIVHETRRRFYSTLKGLYWQQFEEGQCFGSSVLSLTEAANRGLDDEKSPIADWIYLEKHIYPPGFMSVLPRLSRIPLLGRFFKQLQYRYITAAYDVCQNFIRAHIEAEELLDEMEIDINKEIFEKVMLEPRYQIDLARKFLYDYIVDTYPEVYIYVQTRQASYTVLYAERASVKEAYQQGVITEIEHETLMRALRRKIRKVHLNTSLRVPSLLDLLKCCYLFKDLTEQELRLLADKAHEDTVNSGDAIFEDNADITRVTVVLKGRVHEVGSEYSEEYRAGDTVGVQYLLPQYDKTRTRASAEISSVLAFISHSTIKGLLSNDLFERKMWLQGAKSAIHMSRGQFGLLGQVDKATLDIVFANSSFEKYSVGTQVELSYGIILLNGVLSDGRRAFAFILEEELTTVTAVQPCILLRFTAEFSGYLKNSTMSLQRSVTRFEIKDKLPKLKISGPKLEGVRNIGMMLMHHVFPNITSGFLSNRRGSTSIRPINTVPESEQSRQPLEMSPAINNPDTLSPPETYKLKGLSSLLTRTRSGKELNEKSADRYEDGELLSGRDSSHTPKSDS